MTIPVNHILVVIVLFSMAQIKSNGRTSSLGIWWNWFAHVVWNAPRQTNLLLMMMTSAFITSWASDWPVFTSVPVWKMKYVSSFGRRCLAITHRNWEWHGRRNLKVGRRRARIEWVRDVVGPRSFYFSFNRSITVYPSGPSKYVRARLDVRLWKMARLKPEFLWFCPSVCEFG